MNIMVFNVPAVEGGALTILNDFYDEVSSDSRKEINWFFVVSKANLEEKDNIKVLEYEWVKKSWLHRLYFDNFIASKLIQEYKIDKVMSFQNVTIPKTDVPQELYVHQSLPFAEHRFKFKENTLFWLYQNIIGRLIKKSIVKAKTVIVQTEWMKRACVKETGVNSRKIKVIPPNINIETQERFTSNKKSLKTFFYPAGPMSYKNHKIIVKACKLLKEKDFKDYKVIFTLDGDENKEIAALYKKAMEDSLPIEFRGRISRDEVFKLYTKSILIFPSYIETFGIPMLESRIHEGIIFASNSLFSREVLRGYENAYLFEPFKAEELSTLMEWALLGKIKHEKAIKKTNEIKNNGWKQLLNYLILKQY